MSINTVGTQFSTKVDTGYQIRLSYETEDPAWDLFLAKTPGGHHVQTSLWAQVKRLLGWRAVRVVVMREEQIVAGAQLLLRPLPLIGAVSYLPKGPLLTINDPVLTKLVITQIQQIVKTHRIQYLVVQPPNNGDAIAQQLPRWAFQPSSIAVAPTATVLIDLTMDLDDILAHMKPKTRYNIRTSQRKGITVREGAKNDLATFYRLLVSTGQRQHFSPEAEAYYFKMWHVLNTYGYCKIFLTEYEGEAVSGLLAIPFGDTVIYKRGAWSGHHGDCRPNEVMHWTAIQWAKAQGYRYYDFEGIAPEAARTILNNDPLPESWQQTTTRFKIQFGGQVVVLPGAFDYVSNPFLNWTYNNVLQDVRNWSVIKHSVNSLRIR